MSNPMSDVSLSLRVMINKEKTKVLFADADSDFADVLLSFLTLPLGKIPKVLENHYGEKAPAFGSLSTLYKSLVNLDNAHFVNDAAQMMLMNPLSSFNDDCLNLKLDISDSRPFKFYTCGGFRCRSYFPDNICMYYGSDPGTCCYCGGAMDNMQTIEGKMSVPEASDFYGGAVITKKSTSFIISDDLRMERQSTEFLQTFINLGIRVADGAEIKIVKLGINEVIGLLKCCLLSETPLTDLILNNGQNSSSSTKQSKTRPWFHHIEKKEDCDSKSINLKVTVQKSTKKLLFAQSEADFVELLFSFLTIPLGGVEFLLKNNTCLKSVDNLYKSLADSIDCKYFKTPETKARLMIPMLPYGYTSKKQFLPLSECAPTLYYEDDTYYYEAYEELHCRMVSCFSSPKGVGNYMKEDATYMITDDLTVTPFCMTSGFNILDGLNIPLSDVDELDVRVGLEEALSILRASLTSTSALANGLANIII